MLKIKLLIPCLFILANCLNAQVWIKNFEQATSMALSENKLILIDFYADWCEPCKKMDRETWAKPEVIKEMSRVITVKIDIDQNKSLAMQYGIKAIPAVFVVDAYGNEILESTGMQSEQAITRILTSLPENTGNLNTCLKKLEDDSKNAESNLDVAKCCQKLAGGLSDKGKDIFVRNSYTYLNKANKIYKKAKNSTKQEEIELLKCYNNIIVGRSKTALNSINKLDFDAIEPENKPLACFVAASAYGNQGKHAEAKEMIERLNDLNDNSGYAQLLMESNPELFQ